MKRSFPISIGVVTICVIAILGVLLVILYNGLVSSREQVNAGWAQVENVYQRRLDLVPLLQELCDDAGFEGRPAGKEVAFSTRLEHAVVASGGDLLHSSFDNVLRNALAHTAQNSRVDVTLWQEQDRFVVRFEDEGPGVPDAELDRIFGEFYRTDSARSRDRGGYGMGLAIARRAIVRHGGTITARNSRRGLAVTVELPAGD